MECLRDLWSTIDPECCIGRESQLSLETRERESRKQRHKVSKLVEAAKKKARVSEPWVWLRAAGRGLGVETRIQILTMLLAKDLN